MVAILPAAGAVLAALHLVRAFRSITGIGSVATALAEVERIVLIGAVLGAFVACALILAAHREPAPTASAGMLHVALLALVASVPALLLRFTESRIVEALQPMRSAEAAQAAPPIASLLLATIAVAVLGGAAVVLGTIVVSLRRRGEPPGARRIARAGIALLLVGLAVTCHLRGERMERAAQAGHW